MKILFIFLLLFPLPTYAIYFTDQRQELVEYIATEAKKEGVSPAVAVLIVYEESRMNPQAVGDRNYICPRTRKIAPSRGLVQINECFHNISPKDAFDAKFAVSFLIKNLKEGRCFMWSTCPLSKPRPAG